MDFVNRNLCIIILICLFVVIHGRRKEKLKWDPYKRNGQGKKPAQCLYEACDLGKPGMINVHLVPHTHQDLGYKKTMDQYYWGLDDFTNQLFASAHTILDTVVAALAWNPERRFSYVEVGFFYRWWRQQEPHVQDLVKTLVNEGRLEFVMGGWGSNDEGSTHYVGMIDQMALGLKFLRDTFGEECGVPRVAWQIDMFGNSREMTSLFAMMGYDGLFFSRITEQDKKIREAQKTMEMMWFGSENLGDQASLFTGILYNHYEPPMTLLPFRAIMDDPRLKEYDVDARVAIFKLEVNEWVKYFKSNHIMMLMGQDFEYWNAFFHFKNIDKLIKYTNLEQETGGNINAIMSTPTCYLYALQQANLTWPSKTDDFMPLESRPGNVWSGYFTSRSTLKRYMRTSDTFLQTCKQLNAIVQMNETDTVNLLAEEVAIMQHHDAATGTCKQHVADDYGERLYDGNKACQGVVGPAINELLPLDGDVITQRPVWTFCDLANVSFCSASENYNEFTVLVYNPNSRSVTPWVRVPVTGDAYDVRTTGLTNVPNQVIPLSPETLAIPDRAGSVSTAELIFKANLPPFGFNTYFIRLIQTKQETNVKGDKNEEHKKENRKKLADTVIENEFLSVTFDETTGLLKSLTNKEKAITIPVSQSLLYYRGDDGSSNNSKSTVYIFSPNGTTLPVATGPITTRLVQGAQVQEIHQVVSSWASQVFRLYTGERHLEVEWTIGPIPVDDNYGKEIISLFQTDLQTNELYYTDSNGREMMRRRRNFQPSWDLEVTSPVSGNYYPVNTRIYIRDEARDIQFTLLTDRTHGGASLTDGEVEIMLQRRFTAPGTAPGGEEVFDEPGLTGQGIVTRGTYYLMLDNIADSAQHHRDLAQRLFFAPSLLFAEQTTSAEDYVTSFRTTFSGLDTSVPPNVQVITLEAWSPDQLLVRLEHFYEGSEDSTLSQDASVSLRDLFGPFTITAFEEMTLAANKPLVGATRLQWDVEGYGKTQADMADFVTPVQPGGAMAVVLKPMQIRTFVISVQYNTSM